MSCKEKGQGNAHAVNKLIILSVCAQVGVRMWWLQSLIKNFLSSNRLCGLQEMMAEVHKYKSYATPTTTTTKISSINFALRNKQGNKKKLSLFFWWKTRGEKSYFFWQPAGATALLPCFLVNSFSLHLYYLGHCLLDASFSGPVAAGLLGPQT